MNSIAKGIAVGGISFGGLSLVGRLIAGSWSLVIDSISMVGTYAATIGGTVSVGSYCADRVELQLKIEPARVFRLSKKTHELSSRLASLEDEGGYPKEVLQLKVAKDFFSKTLQENSNQIIVYHKT